MAQLILLVEDDALVRRDLEQALRSNGYEVAVTHDGIQALELLKQRPVDLLITDFVIPGVHGLNLVEQVHLRFPKMPVIIVSGYLSASAGKVIIGDWVEFFEKPIDSERLLAEVEKLLSIETIKSRLYRRRAGSPTWHLCANCRDWPTTDFEERSTYPTIGELCNECRVRRLEGSCL